MAIATFQLGTAWRIAVSDSLNRRFHGIHCITIQIKTSAVSNLKVLSQMFMALLVSCVLKVTLTSGTCRRRSDVHM